MYATPLFWNMRTLTSWLLLPASWFYRMLYLLRVSLITPQQISVPVICVGNTIAGGAGKTPTAIAMAKLLIEKGHSPHFISRGYKGQFSGTRQVNPDTDNAEEVGDEPLLLARIAPCWVSKRRIPAAHAAIAAGASCIIMDDGLQNPSLVKDFTVLAIDGSYGFGNGFMLPAGPCREPVASSLKKSDAILIYGADKADIHSHTATSGLPVFHATLEPDRDYDLKNKKLHAFAGIGNPDKFFDMLQALGGDLVLKSRFPDHHYYTLKDSERLQKEAEDADATLVTTMKDYVKLSPSMQEKVTVISVDAAIEKLDSFVTLLTQSVTASERMT